MKVIGITGSIAVGKSHVINVISKWGVKIFDCDIEVKKLYQDEAVIEQVERSFSEVVYNGAIDIKKLGNLVFSNAESLKKIEKIIHPLIYNKIKRFITICREQGERFVVLEIPLLFEKNYDKNCDVVIVVASSLELQKARALKREGMTQEKLTNIINIQMNMELKLQKADHIIYNDPGSPSVEQQTEDILKKEGLWQ